MIQQDASIFSKNKLSKKKKINKNNNKKPISLEATPSRHKLPSTFHLNQSLPSESLTRFELIRNSNRDVTLIKKADTATLE